MIGELQERLGQFAVAFEDLSFEPEKQGELYRARVYGDRDREDRYSASEVGAPPAQKTKAGRANQAGQPVLYLANSKSTCLSRGAPLEGCCRCRS